MDDKDSWDSVSEFTLAEILEMENIYKEIGEKTLNKEFCQELATNFSCSSNRMGKSAVTWQQVQIWFQEKQMETQSKQRPSPMALELFVDLSSANSSKPPGSLRRHKGKVEDLKELSFEARSSKDYAWYDVDSFLTYRVLSTGELEVRVRFSGFAKTEDEWVNVEKAVRERSIPLEPSECNMVKIGDLVLCYQTQRPDDLLIFPCNSPVYVLALRSNGRVYLTDIDGEGTVRKDREHYQVYYDAHVVDIQRRVHDVRGCSCIFVVCYDHDYSKEKVPLQRLCCRPPQ